MKIKQIEIANFGKFSDFSLNFDDDFQVVFGNNEDGKSTIMSFILLMFYSNHGRAQSLEQKSRQLYAPWNSSNMEGAVLFSHAGVDYRLEKIFGNTPAKDKISLINLNNSKEVKLPKNMEVGKYFLGLNLSAFKRTGFIAQLGSITADKNDDIAEKLILNLVKGDNFDAPQQEVIARLEDAKYKLVSKSGSKGLLSESQQELERLKSEKIQLEITLEEQSQVQHQYHILKRQLSELSEAERRLEGYKQSENIQKIKQLLESSLAVNQLEQSLFKNKYSYDTFKVYFDNLKNLEIQIEQTKNTLNTLGTNSHNKVITKEDALLHANLLEQVNRLSIIQQSQWQTLTTIKLRLAQNQDNLQELTLETANITPQNGLSEQKATYDRLTENLDSQIKSKIELSNKISSKSAQLSEKMSQHEQISVPKPSKGAKIILQVCNILIILQLIGTVVTVMQKNTSTAGFIIMSLLAAIGIRMFVTKKVYHNFSPEPSEEILALEKEFTALKNNMDYIQEQLEQSNQQLDTLNFNPEEYSAITSELEEKNRTIASLEHEKAALTDSYNQNIIALQADLAQSGIEYSQSLNLNEILSDSKNKLVRFLTNMGFDSSSAFTDAYISSQALQENKEKSDHLNLTLNQLEGNLLLELAFFDSSADISNANEIIATLTNYYKRYLNLKDQTDITARAMGITDYNPAALEKIVSTSSHSDILPPSQISELEEKISVLKSKNLVGAMEELRQKLYPVKTQPEQLDLEIAELQKQVDDATDYYNSLSLALEIMKQADEEIKTSFGPILNQKAGEILSQITNQKYTDLLINNEYEIRVRSGVHFREWQYLSSGTIDQAYLALRLAVSELVAENNFSMPLLLDDVLINYDDTRAKKAMEFLKNYAKNKNVQIVLFTCHDRISKFSSELLVDTINL